MLRIAPRGVLALIEAQHLTIKESTRPVPPYFAMEYTRCVDYIAKGKNKPGSALLFTRPLVPGRVVKRKPSASPQVEGRH